MVSFNYAVLSVGLNLHANIWYTLTNLLHYNVQSVVYKLMNMIESQALPNSKTKE